MSEQTLESMSDRACNWFGDVQVVTLADAEAYVTALEAKLEAMERAINTGRRIVLRGGVVGDYDGAYDSIDKSSYDDPDNELGYHPAVWPGDGYMVVRLVNEYALAAAQEEE